MYNSHTNTFPNSHTNTVYNSLTDTFSNYPRNHKDEDAVAIRWRCFDLARECREEQFFLPILTQILLSNYYTTTLTILTQIL